jgi:thiamine biosynthesis lipoprotein
MPAALTRRRSLAALAGSMLLPQPGTAAPLRREARFLFGSPAELLLADDAGSGALAPVWAGLAAMNERWNAWKPQGLGPLNQSLREGRAVVVTPALRRLIEAAAALEAWSGGHFNAGIGGLVQAWGFHADELRPGARPAARVIENWTAARPSLAQLRWRGLELHSLNPHLQLDFGAYAKGVAVDWALGRLRAAGVRDVVVNLGGNLATMGQAAGRPWLVGVRDPQRQGLLAQLSTSAREAVVTSGSYERFRVLDGKPCCHLIDPLTGEPAGDLVSVTVVHPDAARADVAATALLVAGAERWAARAAAMGLGQVLVVHRSGLVQSTPALASRLQVAAPRRGDFRVL